MLAVVASGIFGCNTEVTVSGSSLPSGAVTGSASSGEGPLGAPSLRADVFGGSVLLSWIPPLRTSGSLQYHVYRQLAGVNNPEQVATNLSTISYMDQTAVPGLIYEYFVVTVRNGSVSAASNLQMAKAISPFSMQQPLQDPSGNLIIAWAPAVGADEYVVVSGSGNGDFSNVLQANAVSPVVISNPPTGETFYKILAKNSVGTGATVSSSNVYRGNTMGNFTAALDITTVGHLYLTWTAATNAQQYVVRVGTTSGNYTQTLGTVTASPFDVVGLTANQVYYARVFALNQGVMLPSSNEVVLTFALPTEYLWPFSTLTESQYSPSGGWVDLELSSGVCRLKPTAHIDSADVALGFAGGTAYHVGWGGTSSGTGNAMILRGPAALDSLSVTDLPQNGNLVGFWRLNEALGGTAPGGTDFSDLSGNGNHLRNFEGVDYGYSAQFRKTPQTVAGFFGNNTLRAPLASPSIVSIKTTGEYSVSAWVYTNVPTNYAPYQMILTLHYDGGYAGIECRIEHPSRLFSCLSHLADGSFLQFYSKSEFLPMNWYHFTATYNGNIARMYINGVLDSETVVSAGAPKGLWNGTTFDNIWHYLHLGRRGDGYFWRGHMAEVGVWNRALTATDVRSLNRLGMSHGCDPRGEDCAQTQTLSSSWTPKYANLVNYWQFEDNWQDSVGSSHGTAVGTNLGFSSQSKIGRYSATFWGRGKLTAGADTSHVSMTNTGTWNFGNGDLTVSYWYKKHYQPGEVYAMSFGIFPNNLSFLHDSASYRQWVFANSGGFPRVWSGEDYTDGNWHYLTYVREAGNGKLYVDAKLLDTQPMVTNINILLPLTVGTYVGNDFHGSIDDLAVWNTSLTQSEILTIFERQSPNIKTGEFISRVMDSGASNAWTDLSWQSSFPSQKSMVNGPTQESTSVYPGLVNNALKTGLVGMYHLDETAANSAPGATDVEDFSGNGNHGVFDASSSHTYGQVDAKFGKSLKLLDKNNRIRVTIPGAPVFSTVATVSFWMKWDGQEHTMPVAVSGWYNLFFYVGCFGFNSGNGDCLGVRSENLRNRWVHVVAEFRPSDLYQNKLYIDGIPQKLVQYAGSPYAGYAYLSNDITISSCPGSSTYGFTGGIDEVAIWNRGLSALEVQQVYARGGSHLGFQVRSCAVADCSDGIWRGPDGTAATYFGENFHQVVQSVLPSGGSLATQPSMLFSNFVSPPANNRYFQYRIQFKSESHLSAVRPEVRSVAVGPTHYPSSAPSVITQNGFSYLSLAQFTETLGGNGCAGGVVYNLSPDKSTWYYWNGSTWVVSNGTPAQANSAATVSAQISAYGAQVGVGTIYLKAYLQSNGTTPCELDLIQVLGTQ